MGELDILIDLVCYLLGIHPSWLHMAATFLVSLAAILDSSRLHLAYLAGGIYGEMLG